MHWAFQMTKMAVNSQMASTKTTDSISKFISAKTGWLMGMETITTDQKVQDEYQLRRRLFTTKKFIVSVVLLSDAWEEVNDALKIILYNS